MSSAKTVRITRNIMFFTNFIIILFMSAIIYNTTELICSTNNARQFLETVRYVPTIPWKVPLFSICFLILLFFNVLIRERYFKDRQSILVLLGIFDFLISIAIIYFLNMSYKGILLLVIANIIIYIEGKNKKYFFMIVSIILYIILDYDIFSIKFALFTINDFIDYYTTAERFYIFGIRNIFTSLNEIFFIFFMISIIQSQIEKKNEIENLYTQLSVTAEELKVANIKLQEYNMKSEEMAKIKERNRLAREIHDTIGHTLTGISTGLEACLELIHWDIAKTKVQLMKISQLAKKGLLDVRRSVRELRPDALERFSLIPAIQQLCEDLKGYTKVNIEFQVNGEIPKLDADEEETLYRVVQESITNVIKHASAENIQILITNLHGIIHLSITDDGVGCPKINEGFGLKHIRERVEMLKGRVAFLNMADKGFAIKAEIPIRWGKTL